MKLKKIRISLLKFIEISVQECVINPRKFTIKLMLGNINYVTNGRKGTWNLD